MEVSEKRQDGVCILSLAGRLDANTSEGFQEKLLQIIEDGTNNLVLDCTKLDYISSAGLRVLLVASKQVKQTEGKVVLCSLQDYIREVFEVAKFDAFLTIVPTVEKALKLF
jgi:anti-sigma B factor antagonist